jgi:anti-anti-sigma factor
VALGLESASFGISPCAAIITPLLGVGFRINIREHPSEVVLALHGEADLATAPLLAEALARVSGAGDAPVALDATGLEFIDTSCLDVITNARAVLRERGRDLVVRSPSRLFHRLLTLVDMEDLIEPAHVRQQAL